MLHRFPPAHVLCQSRREVGQSEVLSSAPLAAKVFQAFRETTGESSAVIAELIDCYLEESPLALKIKRRWIGLSRQGPRITSPYITKPINWALLRQHVRRMLQESKVSQGLEQANQELQQLVFLDSLTQLANRRRFDAYLSQEWKRMARDRAPLSLILCDIDFFKPYNDTCGHQAGDRCLQQVAKAISLAAKRPADLVAHYGGEKFGVILPNTEGEGALRITEEIRSHISALQIVHTSSQVSGYVTLSFGVASTIPSGESSLEMLIAAADAALYQATTEGRDRILLPAWPGA